MSSDYIKQKQYKSSGYIKQKLYKSSDHIKQIIDRRNTLMQSDLTRNSDNKDSQQSSTVYTQSDFAGGVPMNEPMAERYCSPEAYECSDGIEAGCLDNPHIPPDEVNNSTLKMMGHRHRKLEIKKVIGREILDSRGNPTVEAQVLLNDGTVGHGMVPSGASTGAFEAVELRDMDQKRYFGKGTLKAVKHINVELNNTVLAMDASNVYAIDKAMIKEDGTKDKSRLGANSILAVSIACARAAAASFHMPLYRFIGGNVATTLPVPMMNIINGGRHAVGSDF